jgi:hypothetical protein
MENIDTKIIIQHKVSEFFKVLTRKAVSHLKNFLVE